MTHFTNIIQLNSQNMKSLTPKQIVKELDKHIVGQHNAKKSVAIALRNRWRRMQAPADISKEITPKNILMIGPTGVGKTEIARRLAKLSNAPFLKVEATKFTEVGYVGKEVESIIRDITEVAIKQERKIALKKCRKQAYKNAIDKILDILLPTASDNDDDAIKKQKKTREKFRKKILANELDNKTIEIDIEAQKSQLEIVGPAGFDDMTSNLQEMLQGMQPKNKSKRKITIKQAIKQITEEEAYNLLDQEVIKEKAVDNVSNNGIVFLDEIDKITTANNRSDNVSREGVQRDLLPLIEGSAVNTRYGIVDSSHILFIASGAFHTTKPSDLIPELQGRLPIRVELSALSIEDFYAILTEPDFSLVKQYKAILSSEEVTITFDKKALMELAKLAFNVNKNTENIGARRLHTIVEKLLEDILFEVPDSKKKKFNINQKYVQDKLSNLVDNYDLSRYIL